MSDIIENLINIWQEKEIIKSIPAEGRSMYPLIKHGDKISIRFIRPESVKIGDIVAFRRNNATIVHRLIKQIDSPHLHEGAGFIEKGDNQIKGQLIKVNSIFGRMEIKRNYINTILGYIIHKLGYIAKPLLIIPFIINAGTRIYIKLRKD